MRLTDSRRKATTFGVAVVLGAELAIATAVVAGRDSFAILRGEYTYAAPIVALLCLWAATPILVLFARAPLARIAASGLLVGYAAIWWPLSAAGAYEAIDCMMICPPSASPLLTRTILVTLGVAAWLLFAALHADDPRRAAPMRLRRHGAIEPLSRHRPTGLASGADLVRDLERTLGIAIIVGFVEESAPAPAHVRIDALLRFGPRSEAVTAIGDTTTDAWRQLASMAVAWRNANENLVQLWGVGF
jgi:hypothetical protein